LVFLLPLQTRWIIVPGLINGGYLEYLTYSLYATDIIFCLLLFFLAVKTTTVVTNKTEKKNYLLIIINLLTFVALASVITATDKYLAIYKCLWLFAGISLFLLVRSKKFFSKLTLIYSFLSGIFLQALLAIYQFVFQSSFSSKWLGMAQHDPSIPGVSVIQNETHRWLRAYGGLDHPNILGGLLAVGILMVLGLLVYRKYYDIPEKRKNIFLVVNYIFLLSFGVALLFTFSRSAILATILGVLVLFVMELRKRKKETGKGELLKSITMGRLEKSMILIVAVIGLTVLAFNSKLLFSRFDDGNRLENISYNERVAGYGQSLMLIKQSPLLGHGLGNYTVALWEKQFNHPAYYFQPVHNVFLLVGGELGMVGLVIFLIFLFYITKENIKKENILGISLLALLLTLMLFDHWLFSLHFGVLLFWLVLAVAEKEE
jgi:O-antigen ligase